jgi:hypothetical protein
MAVKMSAGAFQKWLSEMRISGAAAGRLLGVHSNTISRWRRSGAPKMAALACAALYHRQAAWA